MKTICVYQPLGTRQQRKCARDAVRHTGAVMVFDHRLKFIGLSKRFLSEPMRAMVLSGPLRDARTGEVIARPA